MTEPRDHDIADLRNLVDRLELSYMVAHGLLLTVDGLLLGATVSTDAQRHVLSVMRVSSFPIVEGLAAGYGGEPFELMAEELFEQLIDNVERHAD